MAGKKISRIEGVAAVVGLVLLLSTSIPKEFWISIGVLVVLGSAIYFFDKHKNSAAPPPVDPSEQALLQTVHPLSQPSSADSQLQPNSAVQTCADAAPVFVVPASPNEKYRWSNEKRECMRKVLSHVHLSTSDSQPQPNLAVQACADAAPVFVVPVSPNEKYRWSNEKRENMRKVLTDVQTSLAVGKFEEKPLSKAEERATESLGSQPDSVAVNPTEAIAAPIQAVQPNDPVLPEISKSRFRWSDEKRQNMRQVLADVQAARLMVQTDVALLFKTDKGAIEPRNKPEHALGAFAQVVEIDPDDGYTRRKQDDILIGLKNVDEPIAHLHKALEQIPNDPQSILGLANALESVGTEDADALDSRFITANFVDKYAKAVNINPANVPAFVVPAKPSPPSYSVPPAPIGYGQAVWVPCGQSVTVGEVSISGGMLYFGTVLKASYGDNDPCLIDPSKQVAQSGNFTEPQSNYYPRYSEISASARRAFLNWLSEGRSHPEADINYVFLYFYGLERRAVIDAAIDEEARADLPSIAKELRRLLSIYGEKYGSFYRYANALLDWAELASSSPRLYERLIPEFPHAFELPLYLRLALGQAAVDKIPVPALLALAWARFDQNIYLRTPATRCPEQFAKLFEIKYAQAFGKGIVLPKNKTRLKFVYHPASAGFGEIKLGFGETPDVTVLTAPVNKLRQVVDATTTELDAYSRFLGRNPGANTSLEGLFLLPAVLWSDSAQKVLQELQARIGEGMIAVTFQELLSPFKAKAAPTKDEVLGLVRALESMNIAVEPDVLGGAKTPKLEDTVVLFSVRPGEPLTSNSPAYQSALLTLQLASAVAAADGEFSVQELSYLRKQVESWTHLTPRHQQNLQAHLRLLMTAPVSLASLKKRLEPLSAPAKETIATFTATVAQADGTVSLAEVKMLEKVYKALGVDPKKVFSDLHAAAAGAGPTTSITNTLKTGFKLDPMRIAALQQDSQRVSVLLASIFTEDESPGLTTAEPVMETQSNETEATQGLMGLDEAHSSFARMLLSRPQWSRVELLILAEDLELMLDGALERINEASFEAHDISFTEGDDPVEVSAEILEKIDT